MSEGGKRGETFVMQPPGEEPQTLTFHSFLLGLAANALIALGEQPHPETGKTQIDLPLARETLDLLGVLEEKTHGNLTADESRLLQTLLADLRMRFVSARRHS